MKQRLVDVLGMYKRCPQCWTLLNGLGPCWMCKLIEKEKDGTNSQGAKKNARNLRKRFGRRYFSELGSKGGNAVLGKVKRDKLGRFKK